MGQEKLQQWRYEEQQWEWNVINNQNDEFPNPYELAKEKGAFVRGVERMKLTFVTVLTEKELLEKITRERALSSDNILGLLGVIQRGVELAQHRYSVVLLLLAFD